MDIQDLIQHRAVEIALRMNEIAREAVTEEDVRQGVNRLIDDFVSEAGLDIRVRNEYALAGGRVDSRYAGVIVEYKPSKGPNRITDSLDAPGTRAVVKQIEKRFRDLNKQEKIPPDHIFGVGCDGDTCVFMRKRGRDFDITVQPVTPHVVERLLWALVSAGAQGLPYTPETLAASFGSDSVLAQTGVRDLYETTIQTESPKALTFFQQWKMLFGEVCGYDVEGRNTKVQKLAEHYGIKSAKPAALLFAIHSYYAVFMKFLAAEIVGPLQGLGVSELKQAVAAPSSEALRELMIDLEGGGLWRQRGITSFLEGDLFGWYLAAWDDRVDRVVREIARKLDQFNPNTLSVEPAESRDLLKKLFHSLFPKSVRHDLGEYYTPDWLAELTLNELGYDGNPDKRLLDPACGSGTFLVMALNRVWSWFAEHRHECGFGEAELARKILTNIIGFDLNPLAVMATRTNYLMAIRNLLRHVRGGVELPVYLCDSIMTPGEYGGLFTMGGSDRRLLKTAVERFEIPVEVTHTREDLNGYAEALEKCVANNCTPGTFIDYCRQHGVPVEEAHEALHRQLFSQLLKLNTPAVNKNGIWARIIKNAFAPLFVGKVDFVAGNPPWVNWESLPEQYRDDMKPLWEQYGLFSLTGAQGRLGGGKKDLSMLFVYSAVDHYLSEGGKLGFVITQSVFKTQGAGDGFRRFRYLLPQQPVVHIKPLKVHDLSTIQVFEGATNRTALFLCRKQKEGFDYPIPYMQWGGRSRIAQEEPLEAVLASVQQAKLAAAPLITASLRSPWLTAPEEAIPGIRKALGKSGYVAHAGTFTGGLNGCYWVRVLEKLPDRKVLIENLHDVGKIKVKKVKKALEADLVYPLIRGRDVRRWQAAPSAHIILAQDPKTRTGIQETTMQVRQPDTYQYLKLFEKQLRQRKTSAVRRLMSSGAFYSMFAVGEYTMADWKMVWRDMGSRIQVAVVGPREGRPVCPEHHVMAVSFSDPEAAHFLCAALNSSPAQALVAAYTTMVGMSTHVVANVRVPAFNSGNQLHRSLSDLSLKCHEAAAAQDDGAVAAYEAELDRLAAQLWGITDDELAAIQEALAGTSEEEAEDFAEE